MDRSSSVMIVSIFTAVQAASEVEQSFPTMFIFFTLDPLNNR